MGKGTPSMGKRTGRVVHINVDAVVEELTTYARSVVEHAVMVQPQPFVITTGKERLSPALESSKATTLLNF
jgi:hypothetical protein